MVPNNTILTDGIITLHPPKIDHIPILVDAVQESMAEIMPWMGWCTPNYNAEIARSWIVSLPAAWESGTQYALVITDAQTGNFLGGTGLNHINYQCRLANLG